VVKKLIKLCKNLVNFWGKLIINRRSVMFALILVLVCIFGAAIGQIAMKSGMSQVGEITNVKQLLNPGTLFNIFTNPRVIAGILCYAIFAILWLGALSSLDVSLMYPLLSLAYVVTAIGALIFLKEDITLLRWMGILLVVGGCFLIIRTG
jgi:drug/metabolite transporter (DMT)-like permease